MNAERRKNIAAAIKLAQDAKSMLEEARGEEEDYFENMPEGLKMSERGDMAEEVIQALDEAIDSFNALDELEDL